MPTSRFLAAATEEIISWLIGWTRPQAVVQPRGALGELPCITGKRSHMTVCATGRSTGFHAKPPGTKAVRDLGATRQLAYRGHGSLRPPVGSVDIVSPICEHSYLGTLAFACRHAPSIAPKSAGRLACLDRTFWSGDNIPAIRQEKKHPTSRDLS
jgi:hypothetical protein